MSEIKRTFFVALATIVQQASAVTFTVPSKVGTSGYVYAPLDPAPVGVSSVQYNIVHNLHKISSGS